DAAAEHRHHRVAGRPREENGLARGKGSGRSARKKRAALVIGKSADQRARRQVSVFQHVCGNRVHAVSPESMVTRNLRKLTSPCSFGVPHAASGRPIKKRRKRCNSGATRRKNIFSRSLRICGTPAVHQIRLHLTAFAEIAARAMLMTY